MESFWPPDHVPATPANQHKVDIVRQCLCHDLSPKTAGSELAAVSALVADLEEGVTSTWTIILSAMRVFGSDEDIAKIVEILISFSSLAAPPDEVGNEEAPNNTRIWINQLWREMGWDFNEEWNGFDTNPDSYKNLRDFSKRIAQFLTNNKVVAHLLRVGVPRYNMFILWTMRTALEAPPELRHWRDNPEYYVPTAAACIAIAGENIRSCNDDFPAGERTGSPGKGGPLWEGKHGFCEGRWVLWKERFLAVSKELGVSEHVKAVAMNAHDEMVRIDMAV